MDVEDPISKIYHGAYFECDEEPAAMDELIKKVADGVSEK
ncbi:Hypothetical protein ADU72_1878 [Pediococcus damnosus]|nr:Hypothetical protein ADU71_1776 [Pediococcus damnosus]AMV67799.1 Hypothetical protein ADU72_1878 [Pediococcus damnosus]